MSDITSGKPFRHLRKGDPYRDRRSGEDRRQYYDLDYFVKGNPERRGRKERRINRERRLDYIQIDKWTSICLDWEELENNSLFEVDIRKMTA